mgnify:FL=1
MSYQAVKKAVEKLEQRVNSPGKIKQELTIGCVDEPDDFEPNTEVFIIGGDQDGHYRIDEQGKKHLIR